MKQFFKDIAERISASQHDYIRHRGMMSIRPDFTCVGEHSIILTLRDEIKERIIDENMTQQDIGKFENLYACLASILEAEPKTALGRSENYFRAKEIFDSAIKYIGERISKKESELIDEFQNKRIKAGKKPSRRQDIIIWENSVLLEWRSFKPNGKNKAGEFYEIHKDGELFILNGTRKVKSKEDLHDLIDRARRRE